MEWADAGGMARIAFTARRNNSLTSSGRLLVFGFIFVVSLGIALVFTVIHGAWPLLPFAGAEMLGLFLALLHMERHAGDYERVALERDRLTVEVFDGARVSRFEFNRCWAQVACAKDGSSLALRSHGREVKIGRHMNEEQRLAVARELKRELRAGW